MNDKYVFLDRDGVINKDPGGWTDHGYVTKREDLYFLPGSLEAIRKLTEEGYKSVIISNQQGVGKGYFTQEDLDEVTDEMISGIRKSGGDIAAVYYCPHLRTEECGCHKPDPGLFDKAREELGLGDIRGRFYVGDTERDIQAGRKAGLKTILVLSGKSSREETGTWEHRPDYICESLLEAVGLIIGEDNG